MQRGGLRTAIGFGCIAGLLVAGVGLAGDRSPTGSGSGGIGAAADHLRKAEKDLSAARHEENREARDLLEDVAGHKAAFVEAAYQGRGQGLQGCDRRDSPRLFLGLERTDVHLRMAMRAQGKARGTRLSSALSPSREAADQIATCPGATSEARALAKEIADQTAALEAQHHSGILGDPALTVGVAAIEGLKRDFFAGEVIFDCQAFAIYSHLKDIDLAVERALEARGQDRDRLIGRALRSTRELTDLWKRAPCNTACSDRLNNDADSLRDRNDPGCLSAPDGTYDPSDQSEEHHDPGLDCATIPTAPRSRDTFIGLPNSGSKMFGHILKNVTDNTLLVKQRITDGNFSFSNPTQLGSALCGPGTTATVEWVRNGTSISWHLNYSKDNDAVTPPQKQIIGVANTR